MARVEENTKRALDGMEANEDAIESVRNEVHDVRGEIQDVRSEIRRVDDKLTHAIHDGILTITNELHRGFLSITDKIHAGNLAIRKEEIDPLERSVAGLESTRTYQSWAVGIVAIGIFAVLATLIALVAKGFTG